MTQNLEADIAAVARNAAAEARQDRERISKPAKAGGELGKKITLAVLLVVLLAATVVNVLGGHPFAVRAPELTLEQQAESRAQSLDLMRQWVDGYRSENGRLPTSEEAGAGPWRFVNVDGEHYQAVFVDGEEEIVHSSGDAGGNY